jgi:hypothetical protein
MKDVRVVFKSVDRQVLPQILTHISVWLLIE